MEQEGTMELCEGNGVHVEMNSDMDNLKIATNGNGNGGIGQVTIEESHESVDAFSFFGGGNGKKKDNNGSSTGSGTAINELKEDDGDSKGFW